MSTPKRVLVLGATGLVGQALLRILLREPGVSSVTAIVRRRGALAPHPTLHVVETEFDELERHAAAFAVERIYCALGTTMRQARTRERFRRVDYEYPLAAARLGRAHGAGHFLLVSAFGASPTSRVFYNRVKGETERDVIAAGYRQVTIARPSLLTGPRREFRLGERIGQVLGVLAPAGVRPIPAQDVAAALTLAGREFRHGVQIMTSRDMRGSFRHL